MNISNVWRGIKKASPIIFSAVAAIGAVITPILAVKARDKHDDLIDEYRNREHKNPIGKDARRIDIQSYKWTGLSTILTVGSIAASTVISWKQGVELADALVKSDQMYNNLKNAALATGGVTYAALAEQEAKQCANDIPEETEDDSGKDLWFDENNQHYFRATEDEVKVACMFVKKKFFDKGYATVKDFYDALHLPCPKGREDYGWFKTDKFIESWCEYSDDIHFSYSEKARPLFDDMNEEMCKEPCRFIGSLQEVTHISTPDSIYEELDDGYFDCFSAKNFSNTIISVP